MVRIRRRAEVDRVIEIGERGVGIDGGSSVLGECRLGVDDELRARARGKRITEAALGGAEEVENRHDLLAGRSREDGANLLLRTAG